MRVLYSFPHRLGADRICYTAWQQVNGLAAAGADLLVFPASFRRPVPNGVRVFPTLARGKLRLPYRVLGTARAVALHDRIVARRIEKLVGQIDIIHTWPPERSRHLRRRRGWESRPCWKDRNAHTGFAMEVVQKECERLGVDAAARSRTRLQCRETAQRGRGVSGWPRVCCAPRISW